MSRQESYLRMNDSAVIPRTTDLPRRSILHLAVLMLLCVTTLPGCASIRNRLSHREAECSQLCEESRTARDAGRKEEAEQYLQAAMRHRPRETETQMQLAEELWSSGRQLAAAEEVANVLETSPNDLHAAVRLAQMQLEIGRTEAAYQAVQAAVRIDPACSEALRLRAVLEERRGDHEAALTAALRLVDSSPNDVEALIHLAMLYRRRGQPNRAAPLLRTAQQHAMATVEQRQEASWQLGLSYADCQRWSDAHAAMNPIVHERTAMTAEDWYQYAQVEWKCGHGDQSATAVQHALAQQPKHPAALALARNMGTSRTASAVLPAGFEAERPVRMQ